MWKFFPRRYIRDRPVRTQTTGYLNLQSCVRYVTFAISAGTNREDDRFPSERRRRVSVACLHLCIYVCARKRNNALTTLADSPGEAQIRPPLSLFLSLSCSRWYPIKQYQFIASPSARVLVVRSSSSCFSKFFSSLILEYAACSFPCGERLRPRTFSRNSGGEKKEDARYRMYHTRAQNAYVILVAPISSCSRRTFVRVTWRPVSGPPVVCFLPSSRTLLVWSRKRHFLSVPPILVSPLNVTVYSICQSLYPLQ